MLEPFTYPITWSARYKAVRAALAGCEVTTPKELCIFMGVDFDDVTSRMESEAARDLRAHGYRREMVPINWDSTSPRLHRSKACMTAWRRSAWGTDLAAAANSRYSRTVISG